MWLLVVLSVIGVAVILERTYYMLVTRGDVESLLRDLVDLFEKRDIEGARKRLRSSRAFEARVAEVGLEFADRGPEVARERMAAEQRIIRLQMERNLVFLGTVGNNAPFVGLLGTVIGVIRAFHTLDETAGRVTAGLMADIGEALVATAIGILVALPCVAGFNVFQRIIKGRISRAEAFSEEVVAFLKTSSVEGRPDGEE